jgi:hypothetical protein
LATVKKRQIFHNLLKAIKLRAWWLTLLASTMMLFNLNGEPRRVNGEVRNVTFEARRVIVRAWSFNGEVQGVAVEAPGIIVDAQRLKSERRRRTGRLLN